MSAFYAAVELVAIIAILFALHTVNARQRDEHDLDRALCKLLAAVALAVAGLTFTINLVGRFL